MEPTADELAGVVDLFGALTRAELRDALGELAFKRGTEIADADARVADAVASYHLVAVGPAAVEWSDDGDDGTGDTHGGDAEVLVVGPAAFPERPAGAEDLPHIMDVPDRTVDREATARAVERRFREEAAAAVEDDDAARIQRLLDLSYELEAWGPVDLAGARDRLDAAVE
ncbi:MAG: hypothetical protein ABEJ89_09610 [Haloarculaceae archaeon]